MRIVVAPGQGSQTKGFLKPWLDEVPGFELLMQKYAEVVGCDLVQLGTEAEEEQIRDTAIAQPLIVASSLAAFRTIMNGTSIDAVAGHSVGEFTAAAIAGVISDEEALQMVSVRAKAMANAASQVETSMAAVLGADDAELDQKILELGLYNANFNGAGQVVVAGLKSAIAQLLADPPQKSRVIELKVAGAFHTPFMETAQVKLMQFRQTMVGKTPEIALYSNQDGQLVTDGEEFLDILVSQVTSSVRWDKIMQSLIGKSYQAIELPPAGALSGLLKRGVEDCRTVPLRQPQDFEKVTL